MRNPRISSPCANLHRAAPTNARAGAALNVSARLVAMATRVVKVGDEQLIAAVREGHLSVSDAASVLDLPKDKQRQAVEVVRSGEARTVRQAAKQLAPPPLSSGAEATPASLTRDGYRLLCYRSTRKAALAASSRGRRLHAQSARTGCFP